MRYHSLGMATKAPISLDKTVSTTRGDGKKPTTIGPVRRCGTCGGEYPAEFAVCPRDATPLADAPGDDPLIGTVLAGSYRIKSLFAEGGMGRVYEAEHVRLERPLAVKVLHQMYASSADGVARFEREARAMAEIDSPYVVKITDVLRT